MATMVTAQEITLENLHEHLEFRVPMDEADGVGVTFELHWDCTNEQLHKLMASEFRSNLDEGGKKKNMLWINYFKEIFAWKKGSELYLTFEYLSEGIVFVATAHGHIGPPAMIKVEQNGLVSMRTRNNYSTGERVRKDTVNNYNSLDQTDKLSFFVRVLSLYNDQVSIVR